jgi:hypothetical protein
VGTEINFSVLPESTRTELGTRTAELLELNGMVIPPDGAGSLITTRILMSLPPVVLPEADMRTRVAAAEACRTGSSSATKVAINVMARTARKTLVACGCNTLSLPGKRVTTRHIGESRVPRSAALGGSRLSTKVPKRDQFRL